MENKTIFITAFHSFISKNILNTDVFKLVTAEKSLKIYLLVPQVKKEFFKNTYTKENVEVIGVDVQGITNTRFARFFSRLSYLLVDSHYLWYKKRERLEANKSIKSYLKYFFEILITRIFAGNHLVRILYRKLFFGVVRDERIVSVFDDHSPDYFFSTDAFDESDVLFALEAKRRGINLITMVRSWDNCFSKGILRVMPDNLIVNNEELKKEAIEMHDVEPQIIYVGGLPQFDASISERRGERQQFFKDIGADPAKKLIFFGPAGSILSDTDWQIAEIIKRAIADKVLPPSQVFVSNHPNHPADFSKFQNDGSFIFTSLGKVFNANPKDTELTYDDTKRLRDLLYHSDLVVYVASTIGIDSLQYDKPQIIIDFDGWEHKKYINSVEKYHNEDHMKKMLDLGGVTVARSPDHLIQSINAYLNDPSLHCDGRRRMIEQQLYKLDGKSGERIGNYILSKIQTKIQT